MYTEYLGIHFYGVRPAKKKRHPLPGVPGIPAFPGRVPLCIQERQLLSPVLASGPDHPQRGQVEAAVRTDLRDGVTYTPIPDSLSYPVVMTVPDGEGKTR